MRFLFKRAALIAVITGVGYFGIFNHTPQGTNCKSSKSPDGLYIAERCLLAWDPGFSSDYVGRLFDAKTGKLLAQCSFSTPVPEILWSPGFYSSGRSSTMEYIGPSVVFSRGDPDSGDSGISLPPSKWDQLLAARPRL
jgi:hypothetical protein